MSFDASTLQMISAGTSAVGAVSGAVGSMNQGNAGYSSGMYQAAVARNNATIAEQNALEAGRVKEGVQRQKTAQTIGAMRASMAGRGIDIGSGSPLNLQADTRIAGELDALTIRNNAERMAYNYRVQSGDFAANSALLSSQADNALRAGRTNALTSIVGGASSVAEKWLKWKQPESAAADPLSKSSYWGGTDYGGFIPDMLPQEY